MDNDQASGRLSPPLLVDRKCHASFLYRYKFININNL